jgi:hypothetical protein
MLNVTKMTEEANVTKADNSKEESTQENDHVEVEDKQKDLKHKRQ